MPLLILWLFCVPSPIRPTEKKSATTGSPLVDNVTWPPLVVKTNNNPIDAVFATLPNKFLFNNAGLAIFVVSVLLRLMKSCNDVEFAIETTDEPAFAKPLVDSAVPALLYTRYIPMFEIDPPVAPLRLENDLKS